MLAEFFEDMADAFVTKDEDTTVRRRWALLGPAVEIDNIRVFMKPNSALQKCIEEMHF